MLLFDELGRIPEGVDGVGPPGVGGASDVADAAGIALVAELDLPDRFLALHRVSRWIGHGVDHVEKVDWLGRDRTREHGLSGIRAVGVASTLLGTLIHHHRSHQVQIASFVGQVG